MLSPNRPARPIGIAALSAFFCFGTIASGLSSISLLTPGGPLEPMWELNPRAHDAFVTIGITAPLLLGVVSVACGAAAYGLAYGRRWGYKLGVALLLVNLFGDAIHVIAGLEVRAAVGIPIVALLLWYLSSTNVRRYFSSAARPAA